MIFKWIGEEGASRCKFFPFFLAKLLQAQRISLILCHQLQDGPVVQLVRIHACHAWGRGFESRPDRQLGKNPQRNLRVFLFKQ